MQNFRATHRVRCSDTVTFNKLETKCSRGMPQHMRREVNPMVVRSVTCRASISVSASRTRRCSDAGSQLKDTARSPRTDPAVSREPLRIISMLRHQHTLRHTLQHLSLEVSDITRCSQVLAGHRSATRKQRMSRVITHGIAGRAVLTAIAIAPSRDGASAPKKPPTETPYTSPALKRSSCSSFVSSSRPTTDSQKLSCRRPCMRVVRSGSALMCIQGFHTTDT